jgi:anaerobic magnesium-protoporphyrin IX monomethyl ester cyclase
LTGGNPFSHLRIAMVDILLIQPPVADFYLTAKRTMPYGLACIAARLIESGFSVSLLDGLATAKSRTAPLPEGLEQATPFYARADRSPFGLFHRFRHFGYSLEHIGRVARASGAHLVGIASLFTAYSDMALAVARTVKANLPGCKVVLGGHHPTALPAAVMSEAAVDFVIRGEGEEAMARLAASLNAGESPAGVPGIVYRTADGSLHIDEPTLNRDPDRLPPPAMDLVRRKFYARRGLDSLVVTAARGCPMACSYCATGVRSWMGYRKRSAATVLNEIRTSSAGRQVGFIDFEDENLTMDRDWFLALLRGIEEIFGTVRPELRAMNGLYPPTLVEPVVRAMKHGGFRALNLSLGSADADQLARFNRPDVRRAFERALEHGRAAGLTAVGYIIVGAPDQDPRVSVDDLLYLARRPVLAGVSVFYPAPGSVDYRRCQTLNLLPASLAAMRSTALPIDQRTSRTDSVTLLRLGRLLNFIKQRIADGMPMPEPAAVNAWIDPGLERGAIGRKLLAGFLHDATLRGVDADGTVYAHRTSETLCQRFRDGLAAGVAAC